MEKTKPNLIKLKDCVQEEFSLLSSVQHFGILQFSMQSVVFISLIYSELNTRIRAKLGACSETKAVFSCKSMP